MAVPLYSLAKASCSMLETMVGGARARPSRWSKEKAARLSEPAMAGALKEMACDARGHVLQNTPKNSGAARWGIVARGAPWPRWGTGGRAAAPFQKLYEKVTHLTECQ